jgi:hypothetical protein
MAAPNILLKRSQGLLDFHILKPCQTLEIESQSFHIRCYVIMRIDNHLDQLLHASQEVLAAYYSYKDAILNNWYLMYVEFSHSCGSFFT